MPLNGGPISPERCCWPASLASAGVCLKRCPKPVAGEDCLSPHILDAALAFDDCKTDTARVHTGGKRPEIRRDAIGSLWRRCAIGDLILSLLLVKSLGDGRWRAAAHSRHGRVRQRGSIWTECRSAVL